MRLHTDPQCKCGATQHAKVSAQLSELQAEVRHARNEREQATREALALRRQVERLAQEKEAFQVAAASDAAYIRRLENRLASAEPEKRVAERQRAAEAVAEVAELRLALDAAQQQASSSAEEVRSLQAALEMRAEEWSRIAGDATAGGDQRHLALPALLLRTVTSTREENVRLAQLAQERAEALHRSESATASAVAQAKALAASEASLAQQLQTLRLALLASQRATQAEREGGQAAVARARAAEIVAQEAGARALAEEQRSRSLADALVTAQDQTTQAQLLASQAEKRLGELQQLALAQRNALENEAGISREQADTHAARLLALEAELADARACVAQALTTAEQTRAAADLDAARAVQLEHDKLALQERIDALSSDLARATRLLQQREQEGSSLQVKANTTSTADVAQLQKQLADTRAEATESASRAQREISAVREAASQLASSKAVLQRTLVAQLQSLREQLEASSAQNQALEAALMRLQKPDTFREDAPRDASAA